MRRFPKASPATRSGAVEARMTPTPSASTAKQAAEVRADLRGSSVFPRRQEAVNRFLAIPAEQESRSATRSAGDGSSPEGRARARFVPLAQQGRDRAARGSCPGGSGCPRGRRRRSEPRAPTAGTSRAAYGAATRRRSPKPRRPARCRARAAPFGHLPPRPRAPTALCVRYRARRRRTRRSDAPALGVGLVAADRLPEPRGKPARHQKGQTTTTR